MSASTSSRLSSVSLAPLAPPPLAAPRWTVRVSATSGSEREEPRSLVVEAADVARVLEQLLADERVRDVVVAPHDRELHARVAPPEHAAPAPERLLHGEIAVDLVAREVRVRGERIGVTRRELDLLAFFLRNPNRALTRQELLEGVWETAAIGKRRTVDIHVRRLRAKLAGLDFPLRTVVHIGYRFDA